MADPAATRTDWWEIGALVAAGAAASVQFGKVAPALLAIGADLGVGLGGAAGLLSVFALVAACLGLPAGVMAARAGVRRVLLTGLWALGAAGLGAALAPGILPLYALRVVEGAAFLAIVVSAPVLVAARAAPADRALAMTAWSSFMPAGIALGILVAPLVEALGWRPAWALAALLPPATALLLAARLPAASGAPVPEVAGRGGAVAGRLALLWRAGAPFRVAAAFACYSVIYYGIAGFLPARLIGGFGTPLALAGLAGAAAAVVNIGGNLAAGRLLRAGHSAAGLATGAGAAMAVLSAGTFALPFSAALTVAAALLASGIGGVVPASLFALVPRAVPEPSLTGPALGLLVQFSNIGSMLAPLAVAAAAGVDWSLAALPLLLAGAALIILARPLRRIRA